MMDVMEDREVWQLNSSCCPRNPHGKAGNEERRKRLANGTEKKNRLKLFSQIKRIVKSSFEHLLITYSKIFISSIKVIATASL